MYASRSLLRARLISIGDNVEYLYLENSDLDYPCGAHQSATRLNRVRTRMGRVPSRRYTTSLRADVLPPMRRRTHISIVTLAERAGAAVLINRCEKQIHCHVITSVCQCVSCSGLRPEAWMLRVLIDRCHRDCSTANRSLLAPRALRPMPSPGPAGSEPVEYAVRISDFEFMLSISVQVPSPKCSYRLARLIYPAGHSHLSL